MFDCAADNLWEEILQDISIKEWGDLVFWPVEMIKVSLLGTTNENLPVYLAVKGKIQVRGKISKGALQNVIQKRGKM